MHPGKLDGHTAAARVYRALRSVPGQWWGGDELAAAAATTCVSTRVSEVRHQLPAGESIEHRTEVYQFKRRQYYRLVVEDVVPAPCPIAKPPDAQGTMFGAGPVRHDRH